MLAAYWSRQEALQADLQKLPELAQTVLGQDSVITEIAGRFAKDDRLVTVGRGYNYCTALEIGLKIKELSYMAAQAYSSADFRHGPIALLEPGFPVFAIAPQGKTIEDMRELVEIAQGIKADVTVFTNSAELAGKCPSLVRFAGWSASGYRRLWALSPGQLLALRLAQSKGYDVDHPRGLRKVT
jgi:glucosamine--fructose-6-phosphate aminotransferase (isomerizing)